MSGVMLDLVAIILSGLHPHGGFGISSGNTYIFIIRSVRSITFKHMKILQY